MKKILVSLFVLLATSAIANSFYNATGNPQPFSRESSAVIQTEFGLIQNGFNLVAPIASPAFTGIPTAPTATVGTSTSQLATTAFVANTAFTNALPGQYGNANGVLTTNGSAASWNLVSLTGSVTGTLPVYNGGTGSSTSTGTGSVVLSTSPTLTTPALGTPSSVSLLHGTGLPLTTGVTGTLPVANGGTGVTTSTGSGSVVLYNAPTLVAPALGTPSSAVLTNATGLPLTSGVTGTLSASNGGTGSAGSLTGVLYGNGSSAHTVATASQIVSAIGSTPVANATTATNLSSTLSISGGGTGVNSLPSGILIGGGPISGIASSIGNLGQVPRSTLTGWAVQQIGLGISGEVWSDQSGSGRVTGTTYYNLRTYPIMVSISLQRTSSTGTGLYVGGVLVAHAGGSSGTLELPASAIVPAGGSYYISGDGYTKWAELF